MNDTARAVLAGATETAVLVLVPETERAVAEHRSHLDVAASWGVPAHLSVVYPFVPPAEADDEVLARLAAAVGTVPAFDCAFERTAWFDEDVLWLAPAPDGPFRRLTRAVVAAFPAHQPYGGMYEEPTPHLTVGERRLGTVAELRAAERAAAEHLPIRAQVSRAVLLAGRPEADSWRQVETFELGGPTSGNQGSARSSRPRVPRTRGGPEPGSDPGVPRWSSRAPIGRLPP